MKKDIVKIICQNRTAYFDYFIDVVKAGLVLQGLEGKSIRQGKVNSNDRFARIQKEEVYLHKAHISPCPFTPQNSYDPTRKLLLRRREI